MLNRDVKAVHELLYEIKEELGAESVSAETGYDGRGIKFLVHWRDGGAEYNVDSTTVFSARFDVKKVIVEEFKRLRNQATGGRS